MYQLKFEPQKIVEIKHDRDQFIIQLESGLIIKIFHEQDCCEHVRIVDIDGDPDDLIGATLYEVSERTSTEINVFDELAMSSSEIQPSDDSCTWTFYHINTTKGGLVLRWLGESNGYYSESVSMYLYGTDGKQIK